jgi:hypothetical protein
MGEEQDSCLEALGVHFSGVLDSASETVCSVASGAAQAVASAVFKRRFKLRFQLLCGLMAGAVVVGCRTPVQEESFSKPFDAQRVAQLSHEAFKVAYDARFWAGHDLRFAAFRPTAVDYEAVSYLSELTRKVPWIAHEVEKNPASPRVSSKAAYDVVAYKAMMLRQRYQPYFFQVFDRCEG